jgi:hypothetical protein
MLDEMISKSSPTFLSERMFRDQMLYSALLAELL